MNNYNKKSEQINTSKQVDQSMFRRILMVLFGLIETMLGFRFVFKLAGANPANALIKMLYDITEPIVGVFANIFTPGTTEGLETASVFEPGTLIAMVVIALIVIAIGKLMPNDTQVHTYTSERANTSNNNNTNANYRSDLPNRNDNTNTTDHVNYTDQVNNTDHVNNADNLSNTDPYKSNEIINNDGNKGDLK